MNVTARLGASLLIVTCVPAAAAAQPPARSFQELQRRIQIGETVYVVDGSGNQTTGKVESLSNTAIGLVVDGNRRDFVEGTIARIDRRRRDSVKNGLAIGLGSGALLGLLAGRAADSPTCPRPGVECGQGAALGTVAGALWGGVGGWLVDELIRSREIIYLR